MLHLHLSRLFVNFIVENCVVCATYSGSSAAKVLWMWFTFIYFSYFDVFNSCVTASWTNRISHNVHLLTMVTSCV